MINFQFAMFNRKSSTHAALSAHRSQSVSVTQDNQNNQNKDVSPV